jgi:hypothetical protein
MTRTDVVASSRPQAAGAAPRSRGSSSRVSRGLLALPVVLLLAIALAAPALGASGGSVTSNYGTKAPEPTAKPGSGSGPSSGTSPSKSTKTPTTPSKETAPATTSSAPTTTMHHAKASSLPFTGFDLRWTVGAGLLLMGMGFSLVTVQRLKRRNTGR